jgi:hypothetical protein
MFFFNYNRINMHLGSDVMSGPINEFFSPDRAEQLHRTVASLRPAEREKAVLQAMKDATRGLGAQAGIFTYRSERGSRSTHHLMCVSKHRHGMALFKEISAKESTRFDEDVPSLDHNPGDNRSQSIRRRAPSWYGFTAAGNAWARSAPPLSIQIQLYRRMSEFWRLEKRDPEIRTRDIWLMDLSRGTSTRFTFDPADDMNATWSQTALALRSRQTVEDTAMST